MPAESKLLPKRYALKMPFTLPDENAGFYNVGGASFSLLSRKFVIPAVFATVWLLIISGTSMLPLLLLLTILLLPFSGYLVFLYLKWKSSQKLRMEVSPWPLEIGQPFTVKMTLLDKKLKLPIVKVSCMEIFVEHSGDTSTILKEPVLETTVTGDPVISCLDGSRLWNGSGHIPPKAPASFNGNSNFIEWSINAFISETHIEAPLVYKVPVVIPEMAQVIHG